MNEKYESKEYEEQKEWEKQEKIWCGLYMSFNDDNHLHCIHSFDSQGFNSSNDIKKSKLDIIKRLLQSGTGFEEIVNYVPDSVYFKNEVIEFSKTA